MFTFTTATNMMLSLAKIAASDVTNTALLQSLWNDSRRTVAGIQGGKWPWLEIEEEALTVASQEYVSIPNHINKVISVRQQNGSQPTDVIYIPRVIFDASAWDRILAGLLGSSDVPSFVYQRDDRLYIQPIPSSSANRVIMRGRIKLRDLSIADYTTGGIATATQGSTAIVGTGVWTTSMAGRYLRITESDTANKGDEYWYEIASVQDATHLTLVKPYQGTSIVAGSAAYTIGQITFEPEQYQMAPIYRSLWIFLQANDPLHPQRWQGFARLYDGGQEAGLSTLPGGLIGQMLEEANESMEGAYLSPLPRSGDTFNTYPPYYYPWNDASGF